MYNKIFNKFVKMFYFFNFLYLKVFSKHSIGCAYQSLYKLQKLVLNVLLLLEVTHTILIVPRNRNSNIIHKRVLIKCLFDVFSNEKTKKNHFFVIPIV